MGREGPTFHFNPKPVKWPAQGGLRVSRGPAPGSSQGAEPSPHTTLPGTRLTGGAGRIQTQESPLPEPGSCSDSASLGPVGAQPEPGRWRPRGAAVSSLLLSPAWAACPALRHGSGHEHGLQALNVRPYFLILILKYYSS